MADIVVCGDLEHEIEKSGELRRLEALGSVELFNELDPPREILVPKLRGARAILDFRGRVALDGETLGRLPGLELVASTGPHRIDVQAATKLGIVVANTPGISTAAVADYVCGLVLALARHIVSGDNAMRRHSWEPVTGIDLSGKTFGILGLGRIGSAVARRMAAFEMNLIAWGPTLDADRAAASGARFVSEKELFQNADILSVHLRYSALSDNFVNASRLALMKPTALLVDISRQGVVNRRDLADALAAGRLAGAAMDLCDPLPVSMADPMLEAPRTVLTPHMAWQTKETFRRAAAMSVDNILSYFRGEPRNVANPDALAVRRARARPEP
ncbi:MAG TPA: 2-hydroxyacid dehydrogenase [candidate division Zixibacteria bacterium]|nr:2-hydroxyacid dehydrogenase [candidate division Zixibacteria bacterium]